MMKKIFFLISFWTAFCFVAGAFEAEGTIRMNGVPKPRYGGVNPQEATVCGGIVKRVEDLMVGPNGELKNAVVWVEESFTDAEIKKAAAPEPAAPLINQTKCQFEPRVVLIPLGGEVLFHSADATMHHVAGYLPQGKNFFENILKDPSTGVRQRFTQPGPHLMRCGFHPWMGAVVFVRKHPFYALTDEKGHYRISHLPRRAQKLFVWHEVLGLKEFTVDSSGRANYAYNRS